MTPLIYWNYAPLLGNSVHPGVRYDGPFTVTAYIVGFPYDHRLSHVVLREVTIEEITEMGEKLVQLERIREGVDT